MDKRPIATIEMESGAEIIIELYPDEAPNTVNSFISLAKKLVYDGHAIERIVPGYVADSSYTAFGRDDCKYLIDNESRCSGFENHLKVEPGVIAMGGYGDLGIAGGEFFFPLDYHEKLDGNYPAFGKIVYGLEEVLRWQDLPLKSVPCPGDLGVIINEPVTPLVIQSIRVNTFEAVYSEPKKRKTAHLPPNWL